MAKVKSPHGNEIEVLEEGVDALAALGWEILERDVSEEPVEPTKKVTTVKK